MNLIIKWHIVKYGRLQFSGTLLKLIGDQGRKLMIDIMLSCEDLWLSESDHGYKSPAKGRL